MCHTSPVLPYREVTRGPGFIPSKANVMRCSFAQLDSSSQDYLRHLWVTQGKQDNGVFVYREAPSRPWGGRWFFLALVLIGVVVWISSRPAPYSPVVLGFQAGL